MMEKVIPLKGEILLSLAKHQVTMKVSEKRIYLLPLVSLQKKVQTSLQLIMLKKTRPPKLKYISIPPRK